MGGRAAQRGAAALSTVEANKRTTREYLAWELLEEGWGGGCAIAS